MKSAEAIVDPEWNEACLRLEQYLLSHRVKDRERVLRLSLEILDEARRQHDRDQKLDPVATTLNLAMARTKAWFILLSGAPDDNARVGARGRAAYFAIKADQSWPHAFLDQNPPAELLTAVRRESVQAGPDLEFTSLQRKEINYGPMEDFARETWEKFSWSHVLIAFVFWMIIFFVFWAVWLVYFP